MGQPHMLFTPQAYAPRMGVAVPPTTVMGAGAVMSGVTVPNGGYAGVQQGVVQANQGQSQYSVQQGQWSMNQVRQLCWSHFPQYRVFRN